jgi:hypothetical protein
MSSADRILTITLDTVHPVALHAAAELARAWRHVEGGRIGLRGNGPSVRLGLGSLIRPSVVVHFEQPYEASTAPRADQLALTIAAWDALDEREAWRELSAPMDDMPHLGRPSRSKPWAVTLPGALLSRLRRDYAGSSYAGYGAPQMQLHVIGGLRPPGRSAVWWPRMERVVAGVLGRASVVLGDADPLVFDALRAGLPVESSAAVAAGTLAGLVPPSLLGDRRLWEHVADTAREVHRTGAAPEPLMTPAWVARGRDRIREHRAAPPSTWELMRRRYQKLQRDPRRFLSDSRFGALRAIGRAAFSREE